MLAVFTDLDGTLLDAGSYSFDAARPALARLREGGVPLILATSKTRAEVEWWRRRLANRDPFLVENGGAVFVPEGYFGEPVPRSIARGGYEVVEFGDRYERLVAALAEASRAAGCRVRGFHDMTAAEVAAACGLPFEQAALARSREYDEPFEVLDPDRETALALEIARLGRRHARGGRFHHITGNNDKGAAVRLLIELYRRRAGELNTIGLGDALNDVEMLNAVDRPVLIRSPLVERLRAAVPHGRVTALEGPAGWNEAILQMTP
jgi:mannosyl-3-phosphoglycerate phosphatase